MNAAVSAAPSPGEGAARGRRGEPGQQERVPERPPSKAWTRPTISASEPATLPTIASSRAGKNAEVLLRLGDRRPGHARLERHGERDADGEPDVDEDDRARSARRPGAANRRRAAAAVSRPPKR